MSSRFAPSQLSHHPIQGHGPFDIYATLDVRPLAQYLQASEAQVRTASARAVRRVRDWLATQVRRELAARMAAQPAAVKARIKKGRVSPGSDSFSAYGSRAVLWIGVNELGVEKLKHRLRQTPTGVSVGRHEFPHAFVAKVYGRGEKAWRRLGSKRFPLIKMTVPMEPELEEILPRLQAEAAGRFEQNFEHELRYVTGRL
ncbi:hypothetical protein [Desulfuromonas thiophila]|uniref:hypothetical protein n=1 Tax=Desulfuromonas thiophila TaxID=57664 RepID=UPI0029F59A43|nr:hypothetical protein [Desulfuromonas thiophila]